jgi:hypothetical protein
MSHCFQDEQSGDVIVRDQPCDHYIKRSRPGTLSSRIERT